MMSPELIGEVRAQNIITRSCPLRLERVYWRLVQLIEAADALREKATPKLEEAEQAGVR